MLWYRHRSALRWIWSWIVIEDKVTRFNILSHHRIDKCLTLLLWTNRHRSAILVEIISENLFTSHTTRDVVSSFLTKQEPRGYESKTSVIHQVKVLRSCFPVAPWMYSLIQHIELIQRNVSKRKLLWFNRTDKLQRLALFSKNGPSNHHGDFFIHCIIFVVFLLRRDKQLIPSMELVVKAQYVTMCATWQTFLTTPLNASNLCWWVCHNWIFHYYITKDWYKVSMLRTDWLIQTHLLETSRYVTRLCHET